MYAEVKSYLEPLFEFAKDVLEDKEKQWDEYPIYLKATGGLRSLPRPYRIRLINCVRKIMDDKDFNPFFFEEE
jgi:GDA1/CD39 (nucleoside phosphatase) family